MSTTPQTQPASEAKLCRVILVSALIPPAFSGAGDFVYKYAQRLEHRGQLAFLLCLAFNEKSYREFEPELAEYKIVRLPPEGMARTDSLWKFAVKLWRLSLLFVRVGWLLLCRRSQYDIVHVVSQSWVCAFALFWAHLLGKATVYETSLVGQDDLLTIRQESGRVKYWLITRAHAYVAISPQLYDLCHTAGIPESRLYLIGNSVDTDLFHPVDQASKATLRKKLHLAENAPVILFVGRICERKGADLLPAILRGVLEAYPNACLLLVGPESLLADLADSTGLPADIIRNELRDCLERRQLVFTGTVCNVQDYMQASDVFCFPSRREGFGTVLVEAMACGLPSVVHNIEGITSFIMEDGVEGFIVHDENTSAYSKTIVRVLSDAAEYSAVSAKARQKALFAFSAEVIDHDYLLLYERLLRDA